MWMMGQKRVARLSAVDYAFSSLHGFKKRNQSGLARMLLCAGCTVMGAAASSPRLHRRRRPQREVGQPWHRCRHHIVGGSPPLPALMGASTPSAGSAPMALSSLNTVEAYTPGSNTWATVAPMPTARGDLAAAAGHDGRIYAMGGDGAVHRLLHRWRPIRRPPTAGPQWLRCRLPGLGWPRPPARTGASMP